MGRKKDERKVGEVLKGTVKWFHPEKGFGFLSAPGGPDIFVHYTGIAGEGFRELEEGAIVQFTVEAGREGKLQASNVTVISV